MPIPNLISGCRLATAPVLLLLAWYGYPQAFLAVTTASFASDVLDGYLARRLGQISELGAKLDSVGDFVIYITLPLGAWWLWPDIVRRESPSFIAVLASCVLPPLVALFLVTCVCDEGVYENSFRVVEASSRLAVVEYIRQHPDRWDDFLRRSALWEEVRDGQWSAEELLKRIDSTWVDGDSRYKMSVYAITTIEQCAQGSGTRVQ